MPRTISAAHPLTSSATSAATMTAHAASTPSESSDSVIPSCVSADTRNTIKLLDMMRRRLQMTEATTTETPATETPREGDANIYRYRDAQLIPLWTPSVP